MEGRSSGRATRVERLDRCGWRLVSDRVIHGIGHDLSGRVSSLGGIAYLLMARKGEGESLDPLMAQELALLEETIRTLRLLPDDDDHGSELLVLAEILDGLTGLVRVQRGLEDVEIRVEVSPDAPAIRGDRALTVRSLALLLTHRAEAALTSGSLRVDVRVEEDRGTLTLRMECVGIAEGAASSPRLLSLPTLPPGMEVAVREVLREEGVEMTGEWRDDGGGILALRYPSPFSS